MKVTVEVDCTPEEGRQFLGLPCSNSLASTALSRELRRPATRRSRFSAISDVAAMIEVMPLERAADAYAKMMSGNARFRMVLTMG